MNTAVRHMVFYDWLSLGNTFIRVTSLDGLLGVPDPFLGAQIIVMTLAVPALG